MSFAVMDENDSEPFRTLLWAAAGDMGDDVRREVVELRQALLEERSAREELREMVSAVMANSTSAVNRQIGLGRQAQTAPEEEDDLLSSPSGLWWVWWVWWRSCVVQSWRSCLRGCVFVLQSSLPANVAIVAIRTPPHQTSAVHWETTP